MTLAWLEAPELRARLAPPRATAAAFHPAVPRDTAPRVIAKETLEAALAGDPVAVRALVDDLTPVIQARVARALAARAMARGRDRRQEIEDLTQEVFLALFDEGGATLRAWDRERGLSLRNFVGLVTERQITAILRSGRRSPFTEDPVSTNELEGHAGPASSPERPIAARDHFARILGRLRETLSPRGLRLFELLLVEEQSVEAVCAELGMERDAVYAWRSRLPKIVRRIESELQIGAASDPPAPRPIPGRSMAR